MATTPRIPRALREQREREQQERERQERELSLVRAAEPREPDEEHPVLEESLEELVDRRLRHIIGTLNPVSEVKELNYAIKTAVSYLAVKAKLPMAYGTDLDETA